MKNNNHDKLIKFSEKCRKCLRKYSKEDITKIHIRYSVFMHAVKANNPSN